MPADDNLVVVVFGANMSVLLALAYAPAADLRVNWRHGNGSSRRWEPIEASSPTCSPTSSSWRRFSPPAPPRSSPGAAAFLPQ